MADKAQFISRDSVNANALRSIDFVLIVAGYLLADRAAAILSICDLFRYPSPEDWSELPMTLIPIALVSWSGVSGFANTYRVTRDDSLPLVILNALRTIGFWAIVMLGAVFLARLKYSSRQFTLEFISCAGFLILAREAITAIVARRLDRTGNHRTALIIGDRSQCDRFTAMTAFSRLAAYDVIAASLTSDGDVLSLNDGESVDVSVADEVFVIGMGAQADSQDPAIQFLREGKPVHFVPQLFDARLFRQTLGEISGMPMLSMTSGRLTKLEAGVKRALDLLCALVALVLSAPIWLLTALLIKLTSPGPVLFRQERLGRNGRPFTLFKFRTMRIDAEQELVRSPQLHRVYLLNNYKLPPGEDPRLIPIGAFLRALSIDELPQLLNVLRGEMSLVGPRPIVPVEIEKYGEFASLFLSVKPGMTGHWQVSGRSEIQEYRRRIELDMEYIRDQSIRTDFEILLRTVPSVLRRKGAY